MRKKVKKLLRQPSLFLRDYFNKKHPIINTELRINEDSEALLIGTENELFGRTPLIPSFDVDVVFTWCNPTTQWINDYKQFAGGHERASGSASRWQQHAVGEARFEDHGELYYAVLSVQKHLPWVRHIYIVTNDLDSSVLRSLNNVHLVEHSAIIPDEYLPTFNSHVIEACLHNIDGLAENFIYFNDDVFVARSLQKTHFFQSNGLASVFISKKSLSDMEASRKVTATWLASQNVRRLIQQTHQVDTDIPLVHTYVPLRKSAYALAYALYGDHIQTFLSNRFRAANDLNIATYLVPWLMYYEQRATLRLDVCYYFNIRSPHALFMYKKLLEQKQFETMPHSICANDYVVEQCKFDYQASLQIFLKKYFNDTIQAANQDFAD